MKSTIVAIALATVAVPAIAAPPTPVTATVPSEAPLDPARLALARTAVAAILPQGIMQKVMKDSMTNMQDSMMSGVFDMKGSDVGATGEGKDKTLRETIAEKDPHFEERMRITNQVMGEGMGAIMVRVEPAMREGMARAYARRFTVAELTDINRFFASPAGASFARQSFELMTDPELVKAMTSYMPEMMKQMPALMEKVKKATSHLPPPPKNESSADDEEEAEDEDVEPVA